MKAKETAKKQGNKKLFPAGGRRLLGFADLTEWQAKRDKDAGMVTRMNGDVVIREAAKTAAGHVYAKAPDPAVRDGKSGTKSNPFSLW